MALTAILTGFFAATMFKAAPGYTPPFEADAEHGGFPGAS
jgi:hypothetical protein